MTDLTFWEDDTLAFTVDVEFDAASTITDLTGATVSVAAHRAGVGVVSGSATVAGPSTITCTFADGSLPAGIYQVQIKAAKGGQRRTIRAAEMRVNISF